MYIRNRVAFEHVYGAELFWGTMTHKHVINYYDPIIIWCLVTYLIIALFFWLNVREVCNMFEVRPNPNALTASRAEEKDTQYFEMQQFYLLEKKNAPSKRHQISLTFTLFRIALSRLVFFYCLIIIIRSLMIITYIRCR